MEVKPSTVVRKRRFLVRQVYGSDTHVGRVPATPHSKIVASVDIEDPGIAKHVRIWEGVLIVEVLADISPR